MPKYIFVTGGVVSSLGKGIATASIGFLLKSRGLKVTLQKFDPYINVDPGTMSPYQHGEVFVTEDGAETDLDLGHYERFINENLTKDNNLTQGQIYQSIIEKERKGEFLGGTIQVVPHITNEIKERIRKLADDASIVITEIGGTVGDIEGLPFLEAARQMRLEEGSKNVLYIHLTLVPFIPSACEFKTKPTQHSVRELRAIGIEPDIILVRTEERLPEESKDKIALFCNVEKLAVIEAIDVDNIYEIPLILHQQKLDELICSRLGLSCQKPDLQRWETFVQRINNSKDEIEIGLCGKYITLHDAYKSVIEAVNHSAGELNLRVKIRWVEADELTPQNVKERLSGIKGLIIPGGFGMRGIEGKIEAVRYARTNRIPFLGLCLGLQVSVVEFARNCCGLKDANSSEFDPNTPYPVIDLIPYQRRIRKKGGTMRLGSYRTIIKKDSLAYSCYQSEEIQERHRHRYEVNPEFFKILQEKGLIFSGMSPDGKLVELIELNPKDHPFFIATQAHPEFKSRPLTPHPLFLGLIKASYETKKS